MFDERNKKIFKFKSVENKDYILSLNVIELEEELRKQTFSIEDLITVYCERCYTIGREY